MFVRLFKMLTIRTWSCLSIAVAIKGPANHARNGLLQPADLNSFRSVRQSYQKRNPFLQLSYIRSARYKVMKQNCVIDVWLLRQWAKVASPGQRPSTTQGSEMMRLSNFGISGWPSVYLYTPKHRCQLALYKWSELLRLCHLLTLVAPGKWCVSEQQ